MDLVEFLIARLDEDEQTARAADEGPWGVGATTEQDWGPAGEHEPGMTVHMLGETWPQTCRVHGTHVYAERRHIANMARGYAQSRFAANATHIARHDPARVLAEVDAKRRILATYDDPTFGAMLKFLALPYAGHPDYNPAWQL